ncbi:MAG: FAD-dependent oxidoreductase [Pseudomonadota bacterium]
MSYQGAVNQKHGTLGPFEEGPPLSRQILHIDIAIIGGGIAGLWTLNQLRNQGYSAALFEHTALGSSQTIASQGMIHGGIKHALSGIWGGSSEAIAAMPSIWRQCLAGNGAVDLRGSQLLSENVVLFSTDTVRSKVSAVLASKLLRGRIHKLSKADYPAPLQSPHFAGEVYRLTDPVWDVGSLLATLREQASDAIFEIDWDSASLGNVSGQVRLNLARCTIVPQRLLLTAGEGNQALIAKLGSDTPRMQRRPLQQVLIRHQYKETLYGHCLGAGSSPRLTITSHIDRGGNPIWYLGGDLASASAEQSSSDLIERARQEVDAIFPWINFGRSEWDTVQLDRAEAAQTGLIRPESAFVAAVEGVDNALVAWPTKLSLTPGLAHDVCEHLKRDNIVPKYPQQLSLLHPLPKPPIASPCWDTRREWTG